jgi:hypothetical protein
MTIDQDKLTEFLHKFVGDLGATMAAGNVLVGDRLGLYRALAAQPMLPRELAERTGTATRYVDEWLRGQAAGGYVEYDPRTGAYWLTPEQAFALTDPDGAVFAPGAFELALGALRSEPKVTEAFRTGAGVSWHEHHEGCSRAVSVSSGPGMPPIWSAAGSRLSTVSRPSSIPAPRSPTSGAATVRLRP